jgi:hypothetical protein
MNTQTYEQTINEIKNILQNRATAKEIKQFKELLSYLRSRFNVGISKEFLRNDFKAELPKGNIKAEWRFNNKLNEVLRKAEIKPLSANRYFKELTTDNKGNMFFIYKKARFHFIN